MKKISLFTKSLAIIIVMLILSIYFLPTISYGATVSQQIKTGIENFPKSYQDKLKELKQLHPNWNFEAYYTGIDWNELIQNETGAVLHKRSVVPASKSEVWHCSECQPYNGWICASEQAVKYYIDPRNFLDDVRIFQFEELSYNSKVHTLESIEKSVQGTFLKNSVTYYDEEKKENVTQSYSQIILEAAQKMNISPFHIKSKIIQEVGAQGSASVSGTYEGYEGLYNYFNYGSHDTGDPIANGLEFAKEKGWTNPYKAILGGTELIGNSYIGAGQNTSYFFKFDVVGDSILKAGKAQTVDTKSFYSHQYMTNIMDPYSQSSSVYNMYAANGNLDANLNFIIPVYDNMPEQNTLPTKFTKQDGTLYYAKKATGVRDNPSYASKVVYTMSTLEVAVMVSKKNVFSDGVYWDVVTLENGWNCYVESENLIACEEEKSNQIIIDEKEKTITIAPDVTIENIVKELKASSYHITDSKDKVIEKKEEITATGYKLKTLKQDNKTVDKTYTLIKVGDVTGDGKILAVDALAILKHSVNKRKLEGIYLKAADVKKDGKILAVDALAVLKHSIGSVLIHI